jgi:hypothetical protein
MTEIDGYKVGFLTRCAQEGLTDEQILARVEQMEKRAGPIADLFSLPGKLWDWGTWPYMASAGAGTLAGAGAGYGLAKLLGPTVDPKEMQNQELIAAYNSFADQAEQRAKMRETMKKRPIRLR